MKGKIGNYIVTFAIRMIIGLALILFINQFLENKNMDVTVGINGITALTSGMLGLPGVGLLYGIAFYRII